MIIDYCSTKTMDFGKTTQQRQRYHLEVKSKTYIYTAHQQKDSNALEYNMPSIYLDNTSSNDT